MKAALGAFLLLIASVTASFQALSLDGVLGVIAPLGFHEETRYAPSYSTNGFKSIRRGDTEQRVTELIGKPLNMTLLYRTSSCQSVWISDDNVKDVFPDERCGVKRGDSMTAVLKSLGVPDRISCAYSDSPHGHSYRGRIITFRRGEVVKVDSGFYVD